MSGIVGYNTKIQITGTSTAMTTEACTLSGGNTIATITDSTKRVIDPTVAIAVYDNALEMGTSEYSVDYLFGKVTILSGSFTGPVTVTANYLPVLTVTQARSTSLMNSRKANDVSVFSDTITAEQYLMGLHSASGSFETLDTPFVDWDGVNGAPTHDPFGIFKNGTLKLVSIRIGGASGDTFRAFVRFTDLSDEVDVGGVVTRKISWKATAVGDSTVNENSRAQFSWSYL